MSTVQILYIELGLIGNFKLPIGVDIQVWIIVCHYVVRLVTSPGFTSLLTQWELGLTQGTNN